MSSGKDFYKVLRISRTASKLEIKEAYRKLALALHPDRAGESKAEAFKEATTAYETLTDRDKRREYDEAIQGYVKNRTQGKNRAKPSPNYRKVYSPRAPPGFKAFDPKRHFDMHYGDGMMNQELERARKRAERASSRFDGVNGSSYGYQSPLGKGFSFEGTQGYGSNPYARRRRQNTKASSRSVDDIEYEEAHYYDSSTSDLNNARRLIRTKELIKQRMDERRKHREPRKPEYVNEESASCSVM